MDTATQAEGKGGKDVPHEVARGALSLLSY
jgi:hypothetical protein